MSSVPDLIRAAYAHDDMCVALLRALGSEEFKNSDKELSRRLRASLHRYTLDGGLLYYSTDPEDAPRVVVPHDEDSSIESSMRSMISLSVGTWVVRRPMAP
ncbi:hypothetical protein PC128_g8051 [Phytophthora cactorum]|nr:hypothetical protein PC128_g8051 [Phytophthora cactorum]